ncbi:MAG: DUF1565 domain-containing protein [Cyanobacteria bacterium Co-bin8]|nr:DUF1565 domain-containing protein [Cyanobacteria bacterium Co-bin8]
MTAPSLVLTTLLTGLLVTLAGPGQAQTAPPPQNSTQLDSSTVANTPQPNRQYVLIHVSATAGSDATGDGSQMKPLQTISRALQMAEAGTVIVLAPGEYSAASGETFPLQLRPGVTVQGAPGSARNVAVILGGGAYLSSTQGQVNVAVLAVDRSGLGNVMVSNTNPQGYGVWVETGSPILRENLFVGSGQAGVYATGAGLPLIQRNYFTQNGVAGLIIGSSSQAQVQANVFENTNIGIQVAPGAAPRIEENRIVQNQDGLILQTNARPVLENNTIARNRRNGLVDFQTATQAESPSNLATLNQPLSVAASPVAAPSFASNAAPQPEVFPPVTTPLPTAILGDEPPSPRPALTNSQMQAEPELPAAVAAPVAVASPETARSASTVAVAPPASPASALETANSEPAAEVLPEPEEQPLSSVLPEPEPPEVALSAPVLPAELPTQAAVADLPVPTPTSAPVIVSDPPLSQPALLEADLRPEPAAASLAVPEPALPEPAVTEPATVDVPTPTAPQQSAAAERENITALRARILAQRQPQPASSAAGGPDTLPETEAVDLAVIPSSGATPATEALDTPQSGGNITALRERLLRNRTAAQAGTVDNSAEAVAIDVTPPPVEAVAQPDPQNLAALNQTLPLIPTEGSLPASPGPDVPALSAPSGSLPLLQVPSPNIPVGSGGTMPEILASSSFVGSGPPAPPSRAGSLGLNYKVFVPAADEAAQSQVRAIVPDAFRVRMNGQLMMQAGAFTDQATADAIANTLIQQGLDARVQHMP